eukprot:5239754-Amphidinium_carterae.1
MVTGTTQIANTNSIDSDARARYFTEVYGFCLPHAAPHVGCIGVCTPERMQRAAHLTADVS